MSFSKPNTSDARCRSVKSATRTRLSHLGITLAATLSSAVAMTPVSADDTEIFFGQKDPNINTSPNVLFVLDTSGSMNYTDEDYDGTRLKRMKDALNNILESSSNINVGLMRFNGTFGGGSVVYPMTAIDEVVCDNGNCGDVTITKSIIELNDDMEEWTDTGFMEDYGTRLSLGIGNDRDQLVGVRFQDMGIPAGADITSAHIVFTARENHSQASELEIKGHDTDDSPSIGTTPYFLSRLTKTAANVNWTPEEWRAGNTYETPDISGIVQEIVDRDDWCGGQSMGFVIEGSGERQAYAYVEDRELNNDNTAPAIRITYNADNVSADRGCSRKVTVAQIDETSDDVYQRLNNNNNRSGEIFIKVPQTGNRWKHRVNNRLRFQELNIPRGAIIEEASIILTSDQSRSGTVSIDINIEDHDDAPPFVDEKKWITERPLAGSAITWNISNGDSWATGEEVHTPDVSNLVQTVVNKAGWQSLNSMAFQLSPGAGHSNGNWRSFVSSDSHDSARAPKLRIVYRTEGSSGSSQAFFMTARDQMKLAVDELSATGGTPIMSAYYEAANYMLGGPVTYGKTRGAWNRINRYHRVSHPSSHNGDDVYRYRNCSDEDINNDDCKFETLRGSPTYDSPLTHSCQTSHIVFLSDGVASPDNSTSLVKQLIDTETCQATESGEACGIELATWLNDNDHNPNASRKQNISTYTIGFNTENSLLDNIAGAGGGDYSEASSSAELVTRFQDILGNVLAVDTSFVGPGATVNQFNRLTHRDDIYYAMFKPSNKPVWDGNLKRYRASANEYGQVEIHDRVGNAVINEETGFFSDTAKSFWGTGTDGNSVEKGGAAEKMSLSGPNGAGTRNVFTFIGAIPADGVDLTASDDYKLHEDNAAITESMLGISDSDAAVREQTRQDLLQWARGVDLLDEDFDGSENDVRQHIGDPMHSKPVILNYDGNGSDDYTTIFVATNEGMLHAIEHETGTELAAFMPQELLGNIGSLYENQQSTQHPYGLDGDMTLWHGDTNGNVVVDGNEKAYLFVGMRRGGNLYYGFDVSNRLAPKLMWKIEGGAGDFANLAQTWSKPVATRIKRNDEDKLVLVFGGGYDESSNDPNADNLAAVRINGKQPFDSQGNSVFIADALTGAHLWSGQADLSGSKRFTDMQYSIAADIRVVDVNSDGLADQMYTADMGGQVWRFDFTPHHTSGALVDGGVIARLNGTGIANSRRFYSEPDVAMVSSDGERFLSIGIGSGWRAHPLHAHVNDRFYMIKQYSVQGKPAGYGKNTGSLTSLNYVPLTESDLVDVTDTLTPTVNQHGWMMRMEDEGEKILGTALTVNNQIIFTTYRPTDAADPCTPSIGKGYTYVVNVLNGAPTVNLHEDSGSGDSIVFQGKTLSKDDRRAELTHGGIPPSPSLLIVETRRTSTPDSSDPSAPSIPGDGSTGTGGSAYGGTGESVVTTDLGISARVNLEIIPVEIDNLTKRMYWQDRGRGSRTPAEISSSATAEETRATDVSENGSE